jgi:hypothetical protein
MNAPKNSTTPQRPQKSTGEPPAHDERGWAGQKGQRPANEEEKNYRPAGTRANPKNSH